MTSKIISIVNRKGGVGKTTIAIALANTLVSEYEANVALLDLDPQGSASHALLGTDEFANITFKNQNLFGFLDARVKGKEFSRDAYVQKFRHNLLERAHVELALIANSDRFWDFEEQQWRSDNGIKFGRALREMIAFLKKNFDYVIADCPPGQSRAVLTVLKKSDLILCPITPDPLALWGKDVLKEYLERHARDRRVRFVVNRGTLKGKVATKSLQSLIGDPDMLKLEKPDGGWADQYGFAALSDRVQIMRPLPLDMTKPTTLDKIYGPDLSKDLRNITRCVRRELEQDV